MIWGILVRLISGYQPSLYSFQRSLPRMPVPSLRDTLHKLFESLKPVCTEEELALLKKQSRVSIRNKIIIIIITQQSDSTQLSW
jgi:hypothetical protein